MKSPFSSSSKRRRQKRIPPEANGCLSTVTRHSEPCHFSRKGLNVYLTAFSDRAAWHSGWNACIPPGCQKIHLFGVNWISKQVIRQRTDDNICTPLVCFLYCGQGSVNPAISYVAVSIVQINLWQLVQVGLWSSSIVAASIFTLQLWSSSIAALAEEERNQFTGPRRAEMCQKYIVIMRLSPVRLCSFVVRDQALDLQKRWRKR